MLFHAVPYAQNQLALAHPELVFFPSPDNHRVGHSREYDQRSGIDIDAPSHDEALSECWERFQNIDRNHKTPDGGRSLMTGDLVQILDQDRQESWWICCSMGWHQIEAPEGAISSLEVAA